MNGIFGIGIGELVFVAIIALVVLGPERLPATFRELAKYYRMARNLSGELTSQFGEEMKALDDINPQKILQEIMDDPSLDDLNLDDINPQKISKDLKADEAKNRKQAAGKKATPKKPAAKKSAAKKPAAKKPVAKTTDSKPLADATEANNVAAGAVEEAVGEEITTAAAASVAAKAADETPPQPDVAAPGAEPETTIDELPENRIAPDDLAENLDQESPSPEAVSVEPTSVPVNGSHDSVEDRA